MMTVVAVHGLRKVDGTGSAVAVHVPLVMDGSAAWTVEGLVRGMLVVVVVHGCQPSLEFGRTMKQDE